MPIAPRNIPRAYRALDSLPNVPERLKGVIRDLAQNTFDLRDAVQGQQSVRAFAYQKTNTQALTNGTIAALSFDGILWDTASIFSHSTRFIARARQSALYLAMGQWQFDTGSAGGQLHMEIRINGASATNTLTGPFLFSDIQASGSFSVTQQIVGPVLLNPNDYIEFWVSQNFVNGHATVLNKTCGSLDFISF